MPPRRLHLDFESFSKADIKEVGAYRYAFDPSTEILCAAMALDEEEPVIWDCLWLDKDCGANAKSEAALERYWDALEDPEVLIYAFNAQMEIAMSAALMEKTWGIKPPDISRFRCAQSISRRAALPASLDKLGEVLNLSTQKDKRGKELIKKFSVMQKPDKGTKGTKKKPGRPAKPEPWRILPQDDPEAFADFLRYCKTDVIVERDATKLLWYFDDDLNNRNFTLHAKINARGVAVNLVALRHAQRLIEEESELVGKRFRELVGFEFTQNKVLLEWLHSKGCHLDNLQAETVDTFLDQWEEVKCTTCNDEGYTGTDADIMCEGFLSCPACGGTCEAPIEVKALRMKQSVAYVSIKKVKTMLECAGPMDNRIRGMLNHHGAGTGRSTNSLVQFQNMKRPAGHLAAETYKGSKESWSEVAYKAICQGISREELEMCFGPVLEVISSCIRHFVHDC